ncbi:MAG: hypothetical protein K0R43_2583 [Pseudoduganella sp.]|jgi:uncharacterized YigZ family protein|nr:hypothetical protein [Pseudoduganella sp.]
MPQTIATPATSELLVKKSRFLGFIHPVADRAEAQAIVAGLRAAHPDAAHVCWALLAGGQSAAVDDGEPGGTAGRPMLDVLRHQDLEGVLAAVVRYYGGIKLGAGGLVRAYTDTVAQALLTVEKIAIVRYAELRCSLPYSLEGLLRRELAAAGAVLSSVDHDQRVTLAFRIADHAAPALAAHLNEAANGQLAWIEEC